MKKMLGMFPVLVFCGVLLGAADLYAEEAADLVVTGLKEELVTDKQDAAGEKIVAKANARTVKAEEKELRARIKAAKLTGNTEKVRELQAQLKKVHQRNMKQKYVDKKALNAAKRDIRQDKEQLRKEKKVEEPPQA